MFGLLGISPGVNFNRMNLTSESIDKLLKDPKTTVEDLLKEEELLQEFRSKNENLINFFDKDKIKNLLTYIIKEQEDAQDKGYKFPFLCSQIFGLEIEKMMKYFFLTNKQLEEEKEKEKKEKEEKEKNERDSNSDEINDNKIENDNKDSNKKEEGENEKKEGKEKKEENKEEKKEEKKEEEQKKEEVKEENKDSDKKEEDKKEEVKEENKDSDKKEEVKEENKDSDKKEEEKKEEVKEEKKEEVKEDNKEEVKEGKKEEKKEGEGEEEEKSEPESTENRIELLDYFFSFFPEDDDKKLNYVLSGYFSSLIINLLSINPGVFLKYIYKERYDVLDKMVTHCYRKSISDTLSKLLHFENYLQNENIDEETKNDMNNTRNYLFSDIFEKINIDMDNEDLNSIYFFITGLFDPSNINEEKDIFKGIVDKKPIMKALIKPFENLDIVNYTKDNYEQIINRRKNFSVIIDIILFFLNNIKKLKLNIPTNTSDSKLTIEHTKLSQELFGILENLIKNNFNKKNNEEKGILQSFNECTIKPLGEYKIKIVDLLVSLFPYFKNISKFYDEILINSQFFENAFDYLIEYEWNNIYQDSLLNLLRTFLNDANDHELLQNHLINKLTIFEKIKKYTNEEDKFKLTGEETKPINHGYYSFLISLSYKINTVMGGETVTIPNGVLRQGSFIFIAKVPEEGDKRAAMDMLYGFDEIENNENEPEPEEKKENFDSMQKYITDDWRKFFDENIVETIRQYENKNWPELEKKQSDSPFDKAIDNEKENNHEEEAANRREDNIFGNDDDDEDKYEDRGRAGVRDDNVGMDNFFSDEKKENEEDKENELIKNDINIDEFEFEEKKEGEKKEEAKIEQKEADKVEEKKEEEKKEEEKKEEEKNEEEKKEEAKIEQKEADKVEEKKEEAKIEQKEAGKVEEKKEEDKKEIETKLEDDKKEEDKKEIDTKKEEDKKEKDKQPEEKIEENKIDDKKPQENKIDDKKPQENKAEDKKTEEKKTEPKKET